LVEVWPGTPFLVEVLLWSLYIGLTAAGATVALRALGPVQKLVLGRQKPWACDVCMSLWTTLGISSAGALVAWRPEPSWAAGPGFAIALLTLRKLTEPVYAPRGLSELEDSE